jgi:hypothetical protein
MDSKTIRAGLLTALILLGCGGGAYAQEKTITPEKSALIKELFEATGLTQNMDAMLDAVSKQQERELPKSIAQSVARDRNLTPEEQAALEERLRQSSLRATRRMNEVFRQINYLQLFADIAAPIFDKHFTESELKDWIAFYKSPVGRKSVELMPVMMAEMMPKMSDALFPRIQAEMDKIIEDEAKLLEQEAKPTPTPPPKTSPKTGQRRRH